MSKPSKTIRPILDLRREDVGDLESVLRGYYRSQIKSLEKRKDRKLARKLLQDHLVLPKSRQRTSKDAGYIKEILDIDSPLLDRLEESRLVRRIHKTGANPIYEVSHDTLVEPILAERNNREAIIRFIKKTWKYVALLLLLWFLLGMFFENTFEVIPDLPREPKRLEVVMDKDIIGFERIDDQTFMALSPLLLEESLVPEDSLFLKVPMGAFGLSRLQSLSREDVTNQADTLSIVLNRPIEIPAGPEASSGALQSFSNVIVPLSYGGSAASNLYARVSGGARMVSSVSLDENQGEEQDISENDPTSYDQIPLGGPAVEVNLGDTLLRARTMNQNVPVSFSLRLSDLFDNAVDKNNIQNLFGDRQIKLNYTVRVGAAPPPPPPPVVQVPSVEGIEVQYSDGTKRFIPNTAENSSSNTTHVVVAGETLFSIAKLYNLKDASGNTSTQALIAVNGLQSNALKVGQVLIIPNN